MYPSNEPAVVPIVNNIDSQIIIIPNFNKSCFSSINFTIIYISLIVRALNTLMTALFYKSTNIFIIIEYINCNLNNKKIFTKFIYEKLSVYSVIFLARLMQFIYAKRCRRTNR